MDVIVPQPPPPSQRIFDARRRHAYGYLATVRPLVVLLGVTYVLASMLFAPGTIPVASFVSTALAGILVLTGSTLARYVDPLKLILPTIVLDTVFLLMVVAFGPDARATTTNMLFVLIAMAYFCTWRQTLVLTVACTGALTVISRFVAGWDEELVMPTAVFSIMITGLLLTFVAKQSRSTERLLANLAEEQQSVIDGAAKLSRMRDRLVANVSHELRTPLTTTLGFIETLMRDDLDLSPADRRRLMGLARDGGRRLSALVEDLLALGATGPDSLELSEEPILVSDLIARATADIAIPVGRTLCIDLHDDPAICVDEARILQMLNRLILNGMHHGAGEVRVACTQVDRTVLIDIEDDGEGVVPDSADELFLPFSRFSDRSDATGLGLAICRSIVEAHRGSVRYLRIHERTTFRVELPLDGGATINEAERVTAAAAEAAAEASGPGGAGQPAR